MFLTLVSCGGGGGGGGSETDGSSPDTGSSDPAPKRILFIDSIPNAGISSVSSAKTGFRLVQLAHSDESFEHDLDCMGLESFSTRRTVIDLADLEFDQLVDHAFSCTDGLDPGRSYGIGVAATRADGSLSKGELSFRTGSNQLSTRVLLEKQTSATEVDKLFANYVSDGLIGELELEPLVKLLVDGLIIDLISSEWKNLSDPGSIYDVVAQRVKYGSMHPDGSFSQGLTGLVAFPSVNNLDDFESRSKVILLTHATGSTPSELEEANAWYILANLLAAQGYLVVAPDNYGRGGTDDFPETYLQANRTGMNAVDLLSLVTANPEYKNVMPDAIPVSVDIIGYSQGGHSAIASWLEILRHRSDNLQTNIVVSGGAPLDLYSTFRGVMQHLEGSCEGDGFCDLVESESHVPFATNRILPSLFAYTDTGLTEDDIIDGDNIKNAFVTGFLSNDPLYDDVKAMLQLSSFANIANPKEVFNDELVSIELYHSEFDRLVPVDNTRNFARSLEGNVAVRLHESACNSNGFRLLFEAIDKVGAIHVLCGLNVLDDVFDRLR